MLDVTNKYVYYKTRCEKCDRALRGERMWNYKNKHYCKKCFPHYDDICNYLEEKEK